VKANLTLNSQPSPKLLNHFLKLRAEHIHPARSGDRGRARYVASSDFRLRLLVHDLDLLVQHFPVNRSIMPSKKNVVRLL
jgi:hypothetical protein